MRGGARRRRGDGRRSEQAFATERVTHLGEHLKSSKLSFLQIFRSMPRHIERSIGFCKDVVIDGVIVASDGSHGDDCKQIRQ